VSALTGEGMDELFEQVAACAEDYESGYKVGRRRRVSCWGGEGLCCLLALE
jgi:translation initiation factor IF-2